MSSALPPVFRTAATVRSAWRRPARTVADCPRSEPLPAAGGQPGSCKETAMCRRADHAGVPATAHIGRGVLFRSSPKAHHRTGQVPWRLELGQVRIRPLSNLRTIQPSVELVRLYVELPDVVGKAVTGL